jgi:hypothetical protein
MISSNNITSILVPSQLPAFIRESGDYQNFVLFLQAYYEWMELVNSANSQIQTATTSGQGVTFASKNLLNYSDIDSTLDGFVNYFLNDFLQYFPKDIASNKTLAIKFARELYRTKGTPASYKFLFRLLYDSDFEYINTGDSVLKASDGIWYIPQYLNLLSSNTDFLSIINSNSFSTYKVFGQTSKAQAIVENVILNSGKIQLYITNNIRNFKSGEYITIVDNNIQPVYFPLGSNSSNGYILTAKVAGQVTGITVDPNPSNQGNFYREGNPVVLYGGLSSSTGNAAVAQIGSVQSGGLNRIGVVAGGYGYQTSTNSSIVFSGLNDGAVSPTATIATLELTTANTANVLLLPISTLFWTGTANARKTITIGGTYLFPANSTATVNCTIANALSFTSLSTHPISSVLVGSSGSNITTSPIISANSRYKLDNGNYGDLGTSGILAPLQILNPGSGYSVGNIITITGGSGTGANAYVSGVNATGAIMNVAYSNTYNNKVGSVPPGGFGYTITNLPTATVAGGSGASLVVPGILGQGAVFNYSSDTTGRIKTINVIYPGQDYESVPKVSLQVHDITITGFSVTNLPQRGDVVYQGASYAAASYYATVDSISLIQQNYPLSTSTWRLRVYNPNSFTNLPSTSLSLLDVNNGTLSMTVTGTTTYGDGSALATATILNGAVKGQGQYIGTRGQPSSFSVLQDNYYNNFTYEISVGQTISKYRDILLNLLHPAGTNMFGKYSVLESNTFFTTGFDNSNRANTLYHFTQVTSSNVTASADFTTYSTNIIKFNNLAGQNLINFLSTNSSISITNLTTQEIFGKITSINYSSNTVTLDSNVWLTFGNVSSATGTSGSGSLNITTVYTNSYNIINNGVYTVPGFPLKDIIYSGDNIKVSGCTTTYTITSVGWSGGDYSNTRLYVTPSLGSTLNGNVTVSRTFAAGGTTANVQQVRIFDAVYGVPFLPTLTTEAYVEISDESNNVLYIT